ncbi:MAG: MFS transporter, partial [Erysipelotrichaceae bacterium]|nr:MFS transporter [Erysipelotrichaceae bacterium]
VEGKPHIAAAFKKILTTIGRIIRQDKKVFFFLLAFFLYIDGVGTIIDNCVTIGKAVGLNNDILLIVFLLLTQVVAWIGSLVFARLSKKYKTITLLSVCIGGYFVGSLYGLFINTMLDFAILAFIVGCFQGSIQSLSRSYYSRIIPDENSGEYFGLYDIFSKGASVFGSLVIGIVTAKGDPETGKMALNLFGKAFEVGSINLAVAMLCIFFLLGFILLRIADRFPQSDASKGDIQ